MLEMLSDKDLEKAILEKSLLEYVCWRFEKRTKKKFVINHHHIVLCNALEDVYNGKIRNLIINIAPRYSKTEICVKAFIEWSMVKTRARAKFIHLSYSDSLALDNSSEIRESIKSDWYREHWQFETKADKDSKSKWETEQGGGVYATGTMGSITGFGAGEFDADSDDFAGAIIIDDPMKPIEACSDNVRKNVNERLNNTILSRRNNPAKTPVIIIMQRLHEDDMSGFCLKGGTGEDWHHISLPAINDDGTPLWSAKHSIDQLMAMKKADPKMFAGQYMQQPAPADGNILKRDGFKTFRELPARVDKYCISVDCTFKDNKSSDYVVMQAWAKCGAEYFCFDQVRDKMTFTGTVNALVAFCTKHPKILRKLIEDKANGTAVIDTLKTKISGLIPVNPKDSKVARAHAVSSLFEAGNVYFLEGAPWLNDLIEECVVFPNGKHDDQVDAMTQALVDLSGKRIGSFTEEMLQPTMLSNTVVKGNW